MPNQVLRELRRVSGKSQKVFGELVGWGEHIQKHLETGAKRFTKEQLNWLLASTVFDNEEEKERWRKQFEIAIEGGIETVAKDGTLFISLRGIDLSKITQIVIATAALLGVIGGGWWFSRNYDWVDIDSPAYLVISAGGGTGELSFWDNPKEWIYLKVKGFSLGNLRGFWAREDQLRDFWKGFLEWNPEYEYLVPEKYRP
jgi:hypothetical protein